MNPDTVQNQLEKWRRQERFNKILIRCVLGFFLAAGLVMLTLYLVDLLRPAPTLTPAELIKQLKARDGQTVRLKGTVYWRDQSILRIADINSSISIHCQFAEPPEFIKENESITVQGTVSGGRLIHCRVVDD